MSKFLKGCALATLIGAVAGIATAGPIGLGRPATDAEVKAWDIDVRPDGRGLPKGSGDVETGEEVFIDQCAACHGDFGEGVDRWPVLAGGQGTLADDRPVKTIGSYWPYLSTVWDYIHRAMPFGNAQSLTDDEVYAITAYLLYMNDLVEDDFVLSDENFTEVRLPNEANFMPDDRADSPVFKKREVCMSDCKPSVEITARARVLDVTPDTGDNEDTTTNETPEKPALDAVLVAAGAKVYRKCKACHAVGEGARNKIGPVLNGIVGNKPAAVEGFKYSKALMAKAEEGIVWNTASLDAFLTKPKSWAKGTKMAFVGLKKEADREAIIEYLKSHSQ